MRPSRLTATAQIGPALCWLTVFFTVPLLLAVAISFATRQGANVQWQWSTKGWQEAFSSVNFRVFIRTLWYALGTTSLAFVIGLPAAWFIVKRPPRWRKLLYALVLIPLVANSLCLVYAWKTLLYNEGIVGSLLLKWRIGPEGAGIYNTGWASLIGMVYYYLPFMIYPIYTSLEKMDWRLLEASADLGATSARSFRHVVLPLIWPGIATGCILVFIQTMGTFVIPDLLAGNKDILLGTMINNKFVARSPNWPLGAALSILSMAVIAVGLWIYFRLQRRMERH